MKVLLTYNKNFFYKNGELSDVVKDHVVIEVPTDNVIWETWLKHVDYLRGRYENMYASEVSQFKRFTETHPNLEKPIRYIVKYELLEYLPQSHTAKFNETTRSYKYEE